MFGKKGVSPAITVPEIKTDPTIAAMLLFEQRPNMDMGFLDHSMKSRFEESGLQFESGEKMERNGRQTSVHSISGIPVAVSLVEWPVPLDVFLHNQHQRLIFQDWKKIAEAHRYHLIVSGLPIDQVAVRGGDMERRRLRARMAIEVSAALALSHQPTGFAWLPARLLTSGRDFASRCPKLLASIDPHPIVGLDWLDTPTGMAARTNGVALFAGREIEHPATGEPPGQVFRRVMQLAAWLIDRGPVLENGALLGDDGPSLVRGRYAKSDGIDVIRLAFESKH